MFYSGLPIILPYIIPLSPQFRLQRYKKKCTLPKKCAFLIILSSFIRLLEVCCYFVVFNNFLLEDVSTSFWALNHLDTLGMVTTCVTSVKGCDRFLCHSTKPFLIKMVNYLISLWMVYFLRIGLYFLSSKRSGVFLRFFVVM